MKQSDKDNNGDDAEIDWTAMTPNVPKPEDKNFRQFFQNTCPKEPSSKEIMKRENLQRLVNDEVEKFAKQLHTTSLTDITNTALFWNQHEISYPNLKQLALILLSIPS